MKTMKKFLALILSCIMLLLSTVVVSAEPAKLGDVDLNGKITATDALMVLQCAVGKFELSDEHSEIADVDGDNKISASDALLVLQVAVGKLFEFSRAIEAAYNTLVAHIVNNGIEAESRDGNYFFIASDDGNYFTTICYYPVKKKLEFSTVLCSGDTLLCGSYVDYNTDSDELLVTYHDFEYNFSVYAKLDRKSYELPDKIDLYDFNFVDIEGGDTASEWCTTTTAMVFIKVRTLLYEQNIDVSLSDLGFPKITID